jgi:hypothetical protein
MRRIGYQWVEMSSVSSSSEGSSPSVIATRKQCAEGFLDVRAVVESEDRGASGQSGECAVERKALFG